MTGFGSSVVIAAVLLCQPGSCYAEGHCPNRPGQVSSLGSAERHNGLAGLRTAVRWVGEHDVIKLLGTSGGAARPRMQNVSRSGFTNDAMDLAPLRRSPKFADMITSTMNVLRFSY